jgi:hypothetical protein
MFKLGLQYTIGNIFKSKYQNWARILHSELWVRNYGQKGGRKSNWQLDSQAIKPKKHMSNDFQYTTRKVFLKSTIFFLLLLQPNYVCGNYEPAELQNSSII